MAQHIHILVTVIDDFDPETILAEFKSYSSRVLNRKFGRQKSDTWWTVSGSKRKIIGEDAFIDKVRYIHDQPFPLVIWINPKYVQLLGEPGPRGPGCSEPRGKSIDHPAAPNDD